MECSTLNIIVRELRPDDIAAVRDIFGWYALNSLVTFEETTRSDSSWHALRAELAELGLPFLVAETPNRVCGYAYAAPWRRKPAYRYTVEDSIFVDRGETGQGIGRMLLTELLGASAQAGIRQMIAVIADTGDQTSTALHAACGFATVGRLTAVGYKQGRWIDTLLMQREL